MTYAWIIDGFDVSGWKMFTPSPGVCLNEKDAKRYCKENTTRRLLFSYRKVELVYYDIPQKKK